MAKYQVVVGNIGTVIDTDDLKEAQAKYDIYVEQSKSESGRAGGEDVHLLEDGEPIKDFMGSLNSTDDMSDADEGDSMGKGGKTKGRQVRLKSGAKGTREKLQNRYSDLEEFTSYSETYSIHSRLGYDTPEEAWEDNPMIESGTNPSDLRNVSKPELMEKDDDYEKGGTIEKTNEGIARAFLEDSFPKDKMPEWGTPTLKIKKVIDPSNYSATHWALVNYNTPLLRRIDGKLEFDNAKYSNTTSAIQNKIKSIADELGLKLIPMMEKGGKADSVKTWIVTGGGLAKPLEFIGGTKGDAIENAINVLRPVFGSQPKNKFTAVEKKGKGGTAGSPFWNKFWNGFGDDGALITGGSYFKAEKKGSGGAILGLLAGGGLGFIFGSASKQKGYPKRISSDGSKYYQWNDHKGWVEFTGEEYHALTQGSLYKYSDKEGYYSLKVFEKGGKTDGRVITFEDGFQFRVVSFDYAKKNWDKEQIYKIFEDEQSESLVDDGRRLTPDATYAVEIGLKKEKGGKAGASLTKPESEKALEEGWVVSNNEAGDIEIQRFDEAEIFGSDKEALKFVEEKAKSGSALHKKALKVVEECNKKEKGGKAGTAKWIEIRNDHVNTLDPKDADYHTRDIDAWVTGDDDEDGRVIATVDKDGNVTYKDNDAKTDPYAIEMIEEAVAMAKKGEYAGGGKVYTQKRVRMSKRGKSIDSKVRGMKAGWRKSKETGDWYHEVRENRSDRNPKKKI